MSRVSEVLPIGLLSALGPELGQAGREGQAQGQRLGVRLLSLEWGGVPLLACAAGVGKVAAAQGAMALLAGGARTLLVVGTCGGLRRQLEPGLLVHCERAVQADLAVREGRECRPDARLSQLWRRLSPGPEASFLTADRPVLDPWRRLKLRRAYPGPCVADMETAAVAAVASRAGVPWAALRTVTDRAGLGAGASFRRNLASMAGQAADTVRSLAPQWAALGHREDLSEPGGFPR